MQIKGIRIISTLVFRPGYDKINKHNTFNTQHKLSKYRDRCSSKGSCCEKNLMYRADYTERGCEKEWWGWESLMQDSRRWLQVKMAERGWLKLSVQIEYQFTSNNGAALCEVAEVTPGLGPPCDDIHQSTNQGVCCLSMQYKYILIGQKVLINQYEQSVQIT